MSVVTYQIWRGNSIKLETEVGCQAYTARPFSSTTSLLGDHSFCSSDCAGADTHIIVEEEGDGGILPFFAEAMGLDQGESIDEELNVTNATNESVSGSVSVTAIGVGTDQTSRNSGDPARRRVEPKRPRSLSRP